MDVTSYSISDSLFLVQQQVSKAAPKKVAADPPVNNVAVIDCSGSMSWDLPKIREQLKAKLPKLLKDTDTISIIWFSGRGQSGVLLEAEPVATLADLAEVNRAIDRWLKPVGLTGFKEPLEEVSRLVERVAKKYPAGVFSLFFMSDGCDNQWPRADILKAVEKAGQSVSSATFVEYGYYADRPLITAMAEKCGGNVIFAEDFDRYAPNFEAVMQRKVSGASKVEIQIQGDPVGGFAYALVNGDLTTFAVENGAVRVPEDLKEVWYLTPGSAQGRKASDLTSLAKEALDPAKDSAGQAALGPAYAALSLFSQRMKSDVVFALLKATGDVRFIEQFANCFGKQKYSEFTEATKQAAFEAKQRLTSGHDPNKVPKDDAFTVLDLLRVLASDDDNRILLDSKDFKYSKIGRGRVDASEILTEEEQKEVQELTAKMQTEKNAKKISEYSTRIAAITAGKEALKFEAAKNEDGYPISSLTYNEDRPNVSFLVRKEGTVDITERCKGVAAIEKGGTLPVPKIFPTFIFRNYTVIKDGLVNLDRLPVRLSAGTIRSLREQGMPIEAITGVDGETPEQARTRAVKASDDRLVNVVFDLKMLPIINRKMVKETSAKALFTLEYQLTRTRAAQKVFNTFKKELAPKESKGFVDNYGEEATKWLKEQGFTDFSGFSPKSVQAEATDFYMGKELIVSLKGLSTIPSLKDAKAKIASGKPLNAPTALMVPYIKEVEDYLGDTTKEKRPTADVVSWLEQKAKDTTRQVRGLLFQMAQIKFSIIVGQTWPVEFKSLDENTLTVEVDGQKIEGKMEQKEVEIKI